ncbi:hypothetical protein DH2020_014526 [Rehmannia glutinosa]|uniref:Reverse transcriptase Ty1/copia-type domain-containing protein n=1 Tax=Rehmannia glutinosa TaxID=99300 RepID=A0ABR0WZ76_REHGL
MVCKLSKSLYGLKQASRAWSSKFGSVLQSLGFFMSKADSSIFYRHYNGVSIFILAYVDDIIITGNHESDIQIIIQQLREYFSLKDMGCLNYFLGIQFIYSSSGIFLSQRKYIQDLLAKAGMKDAKGLTTPMVNSPPLSRYDGQPFVDVSLYRSIVGGLHYVTVTRPEISYSVNKVSQFMQAPSDKHWKALKRILRYLAGTLHLGLQFTPSNSLSLTAYADADWGADPDDRRSTSGFCIFMGNNLISWSSKKQPLVSRSSTEAEYRSLAYAICDLIWLQSLFQELKIPQQTNPVVWVDNQSAISLAKNPIHHSRTKHFELDLHFIREKVLHNLIRVQYVPSLDQIADLFTKPLSGQFFTRLRNKLNIVPTPPLN